MGSILLRLLLILSGALSLTVLPLRVALAQQQLVPAVKIQTVSGATGDLWPADVNRDGTTDLVTRIGNVAVLLGAGDGTFGSPIVSATAADVLTVRDVDSDGRPDVVATIRGEGAVVLPGTGDGTLGLPRAVLPGPVFGFASVADMDGDGRRDIVLGGVHHSDDGPRDVYVLRGNGDFTFHAPVTLPSAEQNPYGHIVADLNADGRPDIVVANREAHSVTIFLNRGGLAFDAAQLATSLPETSDVTVRDVNADGQVDLMVSTRSVGPFPGMWDEGAVEVFAGSGTGTFNALGTFATAPGAESVVIGDFTRDGRVDLATSNRSYWYTQNFWCGAAGTQGVDTLSILPGNGDGTFGSPVSFALGDVSGPDAFQNIAGTVNTSDVNGDGHTDLLVAPGRVLLNLGPRANRPPVADAGADYSTFDLQLTLRGAAHDPDGHWLAFNWTQGAPFPPGDDFEFSGTEACHDLPGLGEYTFFLTVSDRQGGTDADSLVVTYPPHPAPAVTITHPAQGAVVTEGSPFTIRWQVSSGDTISWFMLSASTDGGANFTPLSGDCAVVERHRRECSWTGPGPATGHAVIRLTVDDAYHRSRAFDSEAFTIRAASLPLPPGWSSRDIGSVAAPGHVSIGENTYTVRGSGADVWGVSDEFHYLHRQVSGDFQIDAQVLSIDNIHEWTKAGLMIRSGTAAKAAHAALFATPTSEHGLAFQRRTSAGAATVHTAGVPRVAPVWLRLVRRGNTVYAYQRAVVFSTWGLVGVQVFPSLPDTVEVGLAVTSHADGRLAAASFGGVSIGSPARDSWSNRDIGAVSAAGSASFEHARHSVQGSGADIWGTADEFHFVHQPVAGDFEIEARVASVEHVDDWTKAGLMIREDTRTGSKHASIFVTPAAKGIAFQRRSTIGGVSTHTPGPALPAPVWLRLVRAGNTITAFYRSADFGAWQAISGSHTFASLAPTVQVGLAVTSHDDGELATAVFDNVRMTSR